MRLSRRCALAWAAVCLGLSAPAMADTYYYYCYLDNPYGSEGYAYTPLMQTSVALDERATGFAFSEFASHLLANSTSVGTGCSRSTNLEGARRSHASRVAMGGIEVEWNDPPIPSEPVVEYPATAALIIEEAEPPAVPPEVMEARALEEQRRRANAMAKVVAENARRDAQLNADLQKTLERHRRRGRMQ